MCCNAAASPPGSFDQSAIEAREDVLVYSTRAVGESPVEVTGPVTVTLYAASSAVDTDFTAKLVDACPCGGAVNLTDGIIRARYRESTEEAKLITPGEVYEYKIDLWATSNLFKAGHRIRLEISSSNFPRFDRNPNTGGVLGGGTESKPASQTVLAQWDVSVSGDAAGDSQLSKPRRELSMAKHLHFSEEELAERRRKTCESMAAKGLDGLLIFRQETMYYLTGYDTMGYSQFQCLYMGADGDMTLITRSADLRQSAFTSVIEDVRIWVDSGDANPGLDVKKVLEEKGCRGKKLGAELEAWTLTGRRWEMMKAALDGFCDWEDASHLVSEIQAGQEPPGDRVREEGRLAGG